MEFRWLLKKRARYIYRRIYVFWAFFGDFFKGRIDEEGYWDKFYRTKVRYYNFMGWKYWHYEEVLNRALLPDKEIWNTQKWQGALALKAKSDKQQFPFAPKKCIMLANVF